MDCMTCVEKILLKRTVFCLKSDSSLGKAETRKKSVFGKIIIRMKRKKTFFSTIILLKFACSHR